MLKSTFLLLSTFLLWSAMAQAQVTYRWNSLSGTTFSLASNWTPARTAPAFTDILVFNGITTANIVVDLGSGNDPNQQVINQLRIVNGANVTLSGPTTAGDGAILSISNAPVAADADFLIDATSRLTLSGGGNTLNRFLVLSIGSSKKGLVNGSLIYDSPTTDRMVTRGTGTLTFSATGSCTIVSNFGPPFGTTGTTTLLNPNGSVSTDSDVAGANSVTFLSGSSFTQQSGNSPFGPGTTPVAVFNSSSIYTYKGGTFAPGGQTYGFLIFNGPGTTTTVNGPQQMVVVNDLTVTSGILNLDLTGIGTGTAAPISLGGSLAVNGGTLNFSPASASTVAFNSPISTTSTAIKQTIGGTGPLNFNSPIIFEINNNSNEGLTLERRVTVNGGLRLTLGLITTTATNLLTLPSTASISGGIGSDASGVGGSFVNGPVARTTTGAVLNLSFPVGKVAPRTGTPNGLKIYRPMGLTTTSQTSATTYVGEQMETPPTQNAAPGVGGINHVSYKRYYTLTPTTGQPTGAGFNAVVSLSFGFEDYVTDPSLASFVIAKRNAPVDWTNFGHGPVTASTLSSSVPISSFSEFSLASTEPSNGFPGTNPLPVELTRFAATTQGQSVNVNWATASEKNSDRFEIQRSTTGEAFKTVGTVKGQGNTSSAHNYAFVDSRPLAGRSYYRLRQVDTDGTTAFSPVATVQLRNELAVYPNPSAGIVTLPATLGDVRYRLLNTIGQTLLSGQATGNDQLDLTKLAKGTFFLELTGEAGRTTQRLVRE